MSRPDGVMTLLEGRKPDRVPINMIALGFPCRNSGYPISAAYNDPEKYFEAMSWAASMYEWDMIPLTLRHTVLGAVDFGGKARFPSGEFEGAIVIESHPVKQERDIDKLRLPDPVTSESIKIAKNMAIMQVSLGMPASFVSRSPLSVAANMCGLEQFCRWMLKRPELCDILLEKAFRHITNVLEDWVEAFGADNVFALMTSPCESNQVISPKQFEKFALPYHVRYHEKLKEMNVGRFFFHVCGDQTKNLPSLSAAALWPHPSILSFGHEVDILTAAEFFPFDIMYGNVDPQVIQMGQPHQVHEMAKALIERGKSLDAGFVLSAGCELPPLAPAANVFAMTRAANEYGKYI